LLNLVVSRETARLLKVNPLNAKLNPICHLLALFGDRLILHISRISVKMERKWSVGYRELHIDV
jgi:hypothetical protein